MRELDPNPKISIAILNYNGRGFLEKILPPLLNQGYSNYEIVIVDNNSSDDSIEFLKSTKRKCDTKMSIIENKENYGYSKGKNICVEHTDGEYILLIDEDIKYDDTQVLKKLLRSYKEKDKIAFLSNALINKGKEKTKSYGGFFNLYGNKQLEPVSLEDIKDFHMCEIGSHNGGAVFFKKSIWKELGGYDESQPYNIGDFDLGPRAWLFGYKNYLFTESIPTHLGVSDRRNDEIWKWKYKYYFSGKARMMIKNYRMKNLLISLPFLFVFTTLKTIKKTVEMSDIEVISSYLSSIRRFAVNFKDSLEKRKEINSKRTERDIFLKIEPP